MVLAIATQSQISKANTFKEKETKWNKTATNWQKEEQLKKSLEDVFEQL
jgi:hypothetical protein